MRHITIQRSRHVDPFNEPASRLSVLNQPLGAWQQNLLAPHCDGVGVVESFDELPTSGEMIVTSDNLWFDQAFLDAFLSGVRRRRRSARAAFPADDPAFLQQGLRQLTRSYQPHDDLYLVDLWYFPNGVTREVEPVIVHSGAQPVGYHQLPAHLSNEGGGLVWWLPERAVCALDTWVHLLFANVVFGVFQEALWAERRSSRSRLFRMRARWRAYLEEKPVLASSAYVKQGRNCSIHPSTVFHGPVTIGDNVTIGPGCVIAQSTIGNDVTLNGANYFHLSVVGDRCFFPVGAGATQSVFLEGASVGPGAAVEMTLIGRDSSVGGATAFTPYPVLDTPIEVTAGSVSVPVDMQMLGGCVGHNCRIGPGMVIMPGRAIESDVVLMPAPERRVIMQDIRYEESDHHATPDAQRHVRLYPRAYEQVPAPGYEEEDESLEPLW